MPWARNHIETFFGWFWPLVAEACLAASEGAADVNLVPKLVMIEAVIGACKKKPRCCVIYELRPSRLPTCDPRQGLEWMIPLERQGLEYIAMYRRIDIDGGWSMSGDINEWLKQFGLEKYAHAFIENEVGVSDLAHLSDDDLKELGLPLGPRRRLQAALSDAVNSSAKPETEHGTRPYAAPAGVLQQNRP